MNEESITDINNQDVVHQQQITSSPLSTTEISGTPPAAKISTSQKIFRDLGKIIRIIIIFFFGVITLTFVMVSGHIQSGKPKSNSDQFLNQQYVIYKTSKAEAGNLDGWFTFAGWTDDSTLLYGHGDMYQVSIPGGVPKIALHSPLMAWSGPGTRCYRDGNIYGTLHAPAASGTVMWKHNLKSGETQEIQISERGYDLTWKMADDCTWKRVPEAYRSGSSPIVKALRGDDGFVFFKIDGQKSQGEIYATRVFQHTSVDGTLKDVLNLGAGPAGPESVEWIEHEGKYLLRIEYWNNPPVEEQGTFWLSVKDGKPVITPVTWESGKAGHSNPERISSRYIPVRGGYIEVLTYAIDEMSGEMDTENISGAYLTKDDGTTTRLFTGLVYPKSPISPDGCRVAFGHQFEYSHNWFEGGYTLSNPQLLVVDVCQEM